jgi:hypothetical protein
MESRFTVAGDPAFHVVRTGYFSASCVPRNEIALTSASGLGSIIVGTNPSPVYRNAMSESPSIGSGRNMPVSLLVTTSIESAVKFHRKMFETPV